MRFSKKERMLWKAIPRVVIWSLWNLRNECLFRGVVPNEAAVSELIKLRLAVWFKDVIKVHMFTVNDFISNLGQNRFCLGGGSRGEP